MQINNIKNYIFVDSHVHIHDCFNLNAFLNSTLSNFKKIAYRYSQSENFSAAIILTQGKEKVGFQKMVNLSEIKYSNDGNFGNDWSLHRTNEDCSIYMKDRNENCLFIIAGKQIVTAENLELLSLGTSENFIDGIPIKELIRIVIDKGGIPVVPWGFGKWIGKRGQVLKSLIENSADCGIFLGDNAGRPAFLPLPLHFKLANRKGVGILAGSDPLPFKTEYCRSGSFGFLLDGTLSSINPASELKKKLENSKDNITAYGKLEYPFRFLRNQFAMQVKKRF